MTIGPARVGRTPLAAMVCAASIAAAAPSCVAARTHIGIHTNAGRLNPRVTSFLEMRERNLVRQGWDISCGAAALSTVLTYHFNAPYSEATIAVSILTNTDPNRVRRRGGFSLLDLKRFAEAVGFSANGYSNLTLADLAKSHVPVILPVSIRDLDHFVVFRGYVDGVVLIGDPAFGNLTLSKRYFDHIWTSGIGFFVTSKHGDKPTRRPQDAMELIVPDLTYVDRLVGQPNPVPATRR